MFTISLCMIVKNESLSLPRILTCAKQFCDEIIIVDTGSTDNTKEIAFEFTNKVFDFEWNDNFSDARNFSFEKATCDYQLWLDADDFITAENISKIQALKKSHATADVFMFKYAISFDESGHPLFEYERERLLKRCKNFKWQGFVHEAIAAHGKIENCDITIEHRKEKPNTPKRNLLLFNKAKRRGQTFSPREVYYYARELFYNGYISSAIKNFKKYINLRTNFEPDEIGARLMLCDCYQIRSNRQKAIDVLFDCLKRFPPTPQICYKLAELFEQNRSIQNAIFWYECALKCPPQQSGFIEKDYALFLPALQLCRLYYAQNNLSKAKAFHEETKKVRPHHPSVIYNEQFFRT